MNRVWLSGLRGPEEPRAVYRRSRTATLEQQGTNREMLWALTRPVAVPGVNWPVDGIN